MSADYPAIAQDGEGEISIPAGKMLARTQRHESCTRMNGHRTGGRGEK